MKCFAILKTHAAQYRHVWLKIQCQMRDKKTSLLRIFFHVAYKERKSIYSYYFLTLL
jgi:hypothetical protein